MTLDERVREIKLKLSKMSIQADFGTKNSEKVVHDALRDVVEACAEKCDVWAAIAKQGDLSGGYTAERIKQQIRQEVGS